MDEPLRRSALSVPMYRRFWFGSLLSVPSFQLFLLGQGWLVFELSHSPLDLGYLGAAAAVPNIVVSLFGGLLADRINKSRLLLVTSLLQAVLLALLAILDARELVEVWHVLVIVALVSVVTGLDWPARQAIYPELISREHMMSAVALNSILWQSSRMVLPAVGGVLITLTDTWVLFAIGAVGFVAMSYLVAKLPHVRGGVGSGLGWKAFMEGVRFITGEPILWALVVLTYSSMLFGTSFIQIMPSVAALLGVGEQGFGSLISATGFGAMLGTWIIGRYHAHARLGVIMLASLTVTAVALQLFGVVVSAGTFGAATLYFALAMAGIMGLFSSAYLIASMTVIQLRVPDALRGRVMSLYGITYSLIPLGGLLGGALAHWLDAGAAVGINATLLLLVVGIVGVAVPRVWREVSHWDT
jgi:MFS family permease